LASSFFFSSFFPFCNGFFSPFFLFRGRKQYMRKDGWLFPFLLSFPLAFFFLSLSQMERGSDRFLFFFLSTFLPVEKKKECKEDPFPFFSFSPFSPPPNGRRGWFPPPPPLFSLLFYFSLNRPERKADTAAHPLSFFFFPFSFLPPFQFLLFPSRAVSK